MPDCFSLALHSGCHAQALLIILTVLKCPCDSVIVSQHLQNQEPNFKNVICQH